MSGKVIIFSAPSGSGKTTIVNQLVNNKDFNLEFSISATTREKRGDEKHGKDYYFLTPEEFQNNIDENMFVEWEEVYKSVYYGTLKSEIDRLWNKGKHIIFDVDVMGGINLKRKFGDESLSIFVMPPSLEELEKRLLKRGTEPEDKVMGRISRAKFELKKAEKFDKVVINDNLEEAIKEVEELIKKFL